MTDVDIDADEDDQADNSTIRKMREQIKALERQNAAATEAAQQAQREAALAKAGLTNLTERQMTALMAAHGDSDLASIGDTAAELGFTGSTPAPTPAADAIDRDAIASINNMAAVTTVPGTVENDLQTRVAAARTPDELDAVIRGTPLDPNS